MQHAVSQMIDKKSKLIGELECYKERIPKLEKVIKSLDIAIQTFDPDFDITSIKATKFNLNKRYFNNGEVKTMILDCLRELGDYIPTHNITIELMKIKKLDHKNQKIKTRVQQTILTTLNRLYKDKVILRKGENGDKILMWSID